MQIRVVLGFDGTPGTCMWLVLLGADYSLSFSQISRRVRFSVGFVTPGRNEGPRLTGVARVWRELKRRHPLQLGQSCPGRGRQLKFQ